MVAAAGSLCLSERKPRLESLAKKVAVGSHSGVEFRCDWKGGRAQRIAAPRYRNVTSRTTSADTRDDCLMQRTNQVGEPVRLDELRPGKRRRQEGYWRMGERCGKRLQDELHERLRSFVRGPARTRQKRKAGACSRIKKNLFASLLEQYED